MIDVFRPETWAHLVLPDEELTEEQRDQAFCHHAATGGDMVFLTTGEVLCA